MRTEDMIAAVQWLAAHNSVDPSKISAYTDGASGTVLVHAAALEPRIRQITIQGSLSTYASVVEADVHRNVAESVVPGVLLPYDLDDLLIAIASRRVFVVHPVNGAGDALTEAQFRNQFARVFRADQSLGFNRRITYSADNASEPSTSK